MPPKSTGERAYWTQDDESKLLAYLNDHKAEAGDAFNFKAATWTAAAAHVNAVVTRGAPKNGNSCKIKYRTLKLTYKIVDAICNNSGWSWDDEKGADITPEKRGMCDDYVLCHPGAGPFCNSGWAHLAIFDVFLGKRAVKGAHVYHTSQGISASDSLDRENSPPWPKTLRDSDDNTQIDPALLSDNEDNIGEVAEPPSTPVPTQRKRPATTPTMSSASIKKARTSTGAKAISDLNATFERMTAVLENAFPKSTLQPSPVHKSDAIKLAQTQEKDWLDKRQMAKLLSILASEHFAAENYQLLEDEELCWEWISLKLGLE
ncbi:hypothetical protein JR316_0008585 [Psilocybe cubensis]|uniref:Myb-like domain-containing protein n=2 Tax=Psilocybe cubensis TaxID=181762 RepID=A0A8H7XY55_PSICU|nr:hypothetical protein JR316_0008585 [Psilocybe cubensis]KAH9478132.1 hypothetical protein JR316_0008585 [Psilocybe cubensis]